MRVFAAWGSCRYGHVPHTGTISNKYLLLVVTCHGRFIVISTLIPLFKEGNDKKLM